MALTPDSQNRLDQLVDKLPVDAVPGIATTVADTTVPGNQYAAQMRSFAKEFEANAATYYNNDVPSFGPKRYPRGVPIRVISPVGFPPGVQVTYGVPPSGAAFLPNGVRDVKLFVLHSFGHGWTATHKGTGWLNSKSAKRGAVPYKDGNRTIYIARGSDPANMGHFTRFAAGLRACMAATAKATAHFFIDRAGNLTVIGDCNMILATTGGVNAIQLGVELEEAFYVLEDPKGGKKKAIWRPGGNPAGTIGNVKYFSYSPEQLLTLSVLAKKLETVYPVLKERNIHIVPKTVDKSSAPGYTMHHAVKVGNHIDISPQFLDLGLWDSFFALVDSHTHINPTNVFFEAKQYNLQAQAGMFQVPASDATNGLDSQLAGMVNTQVQSASRADQLLSAGREQQSERAARGATIQQSNYQGRAAALSQTAVSVNSRASGQGAVSTGAAATYGTAVI